MKKGLTLLLYAAVLIMLLSLGCGKKNQESPDISASSDMVIVDNASAKTVKLWRKALNKTENVVELTCHVTNNTESTLLILCNFEATIEYKDNDGKKARQTVDIWTDRAISEDCFPGIYLAPRGKRKVKFISKVSDPEINLDENNVYSHVKLSEPPECENLDSEFFPHCIVPVSEWARDIRISGSEISGTITNNSGEKWREAQFWFRATVNGTASDVFFVFLFEYVNTNDTVKIEDSSFYDQYLDELKRLSGEEVMIFPYYSEIYLS